MLTGEALRRCRAHGIQADHDPLFRGVRREFLHAPLFLAHSGSTRAPHQVSCGRQRRPSAIRSSSIRLPLLAIPCCSCTYASSRSRVHEAHGHPRCSGGVREVAITAATCGGVSVAGRPERGWSVRAARPTALKRLSQVRTVSAGSWSCCAIAGTRCPWCARRMMRARSTCRAAAVRAWAHFSIVSCSSVLSTLSLIARGIPPEEMPLIV